ncbi:hypothetical protein [Paenibacillus beijingensis]|uniref:Uncharacterized protein n=1 Tax=Paenibacillus beijingensis TaxID=1126833 RepID=A0A0D5NI67_9BACL|nr:hypothetical protein [Paenibacillus beijingensis]AJY74652.1 hypothetical protein VN24_08770 [Paenibacillus beijingensis]
MKRNKQPGENISLKTKKNEAPEVMDWINSQSNLMDSIRYLIENEVRQFGVRNLQQLIPADRSGLAAGAVLAPLETAAAAQPAAAAALQIAAQEEAAARTVAGETEEAVQPAVARSEAAIETAPPAAPEESRKPLPEDDIDEEDIESWI